jgi:hypothetical protein
MELFILKTNIQNQEKLKSVKPLLNQHPLLIKWSIDLEDIDRVLRVEAQHNTKETEIVRLIRRLGFKCEDLDD